MEARVQSEVKQSIDRVDTILGTGIFHPQNASHPLKKSAFIEVLICLRDLMYKSEAHVGHRISFTDDVVQSKNVKDISDLIKFVRDAVCHLDSNNHIYKGSGAKITFNTTYGRGGLFGGSDYDDDVCFFFGEHKIYLHRHIHRAFSEAKLALEPSLALFS